MNSMHHKKSKMATAESNATMLEIFICTRIYCSNADINSI